MVTTTKTMFAVLATLCVLALAMGGSGIAPRAAAPAAPSVIAREQIC